MKLRVGQPVVFQGAVAQISSVGPKDAEGHRWITLSTHVGAKRIPSDHPELVIL